MIPEMRELECEHTLGFPYTGTIPCTGPRVCPMCGTDLEDIEEIPIIRNNT